MHDSANVTKISIVGWLVGGMRENRKKFSFNFKQISFAIITITYLSVIRKFNGQNDFDETIRAPSRKSAKRSFN